eukprot:182522-Prymnesium_polylepis.1
MDDEDAEAEAEEGRPKKPKNNPNVQGVEIVRQEPAAAPAAAADAAATADKPAEVEPLPAGYSCVRPADQGAAGSFELALEVSVSQSVTRTRVTGIHAQQISVAVKGTDRNNEANGVLCSFLRSILGGPSVTCDILRGERVSGASKEIASQWNQQDTRRD